MEIKNFSESMAKMGFYNVEKITDSRVEFEVVNFDTEYKKRVDFSIAINKNGTFEVFPATEKNAIYSCDINLENLNRAFNLIKSFYFEVK